MLLISLKLLLGDQLNQLLYTLCFRRALEVNMLYKYQQMPLKWNAYGIILWHYSR